MAFTPLAYLPDRLGMMIWNVASIALLVWALHVLVRDVLPGDWPPQRESAFLTLTLAGSAVGIWSGQSNAIITALIMLALAAIVRQRWWTASILLAVPVFIKIWPLAIVMLLLVFWPRQLSWRFAVACAVLALVPFLTRPPSTVAWQYHEWYDGLTGPLQGRWGGYRDAWTIWEQLCAAGRITMSTWRCNWRRPWACWPGVGGSIGDVYMRVPRWTAVRCVRGTLVSGQTFAAVARSAATCLSQPALLMLIFSIWAAWQLFLGPGTEQLTYGIIAPSAAWAVMVSFAEKRARWLTVTAWAMLALLPSGDIEKAVLPLFPAGRSCCRLAYASCAVWHERGERVSG